MGESGTHRTRPSPGPIRTDMSRTWISILNSTLGTSPTIGPFSTHPRILTFRLILTICLPQPEEPFDFQTCFATGWGKDQLGAAGNYQVVLKEISIFLVLSGKGQMLLNRQIHL